VRYACLGNGRLYLGWDGRCRLRELFWPTVGLANHVRETRENRMVLWCGGRFFDLGGEDFLSAGRYLPGMGFAWRHRRLSMPLEVRVRDYVDPYLPVWTRAVELADLPGQAGIFSVQSYALGENTSGEEAAWDAEKGRLYHFKGPVWVAVQLRAGGAVRTRAAVAKVRDGGVTFWAETGEILGPAVDHGLIQSALGVRLDALPDSPAGRPAGTPLGRRVEYALAFGRDRDEADANLDRAGDARAVEARSRRWWRSLTAKGWAGRPGYDLSAETSLKILSAHCDLGGGVIASCDTDVLGDHRDHYRYVWPRDAAMCASALLRAGYPGYAGRYLEFCARALSLGGFFWQRYRPDGTRGSGWHPWDLPPGELPIQEDATALSLVTAGDFLDLAGDLRFLDGIYASFVGKAARFVLDYRTPDGTLVRPSFDLWEERRGTLSFTQAACAGALSAAARIARALGREEDRREFWAGAGALLRGLALHLSDEDRGLCRGITASPDACDRLEKDWTDDASLFLVPVLLPEAVPGSGALLRCLRRRSAVTWKRLRSSLAVRLPLTDVPGYARYAGDWYHRPAGAGDVPGNPWPVATAWYALSGVRLGLLGRQDLARHLEWFRAVAQESGTMPEQVSAVTGEPLSVSPLAWSHAMYLELATAASEGCASSPGSRPVIPPGTAGQDKGETEEGDSL